MPFAATRGKLAKGKSLSFVSRPKTTELMMISRKVAFAALLIAGMPLAAIAEEKAAGAQQASMDEFAKSCEGIVKELYFLPELSPAFQSPADAVASTCSCMQSQVFADRRLQKVFGDAVSGSQNSEESKKNLAYVTARVMSVTFACAANELEKAINGIGPRGVG